MIRPQHQPVAAMYRERLPVPDASRTLERVSQKGVPRCCCDEALALRAFDPDLVSGTLVIW